MTVMPQSKDTECSYVQEVIIRMESENLTLVQAPVEFRKQGLNSRLIASLLGYEHAGQRNDCAEQPGLSLYPSIFLIGLTLILVGLVVGFGVPTHDYEIGIMTSYPSSVALTTVLVIFGL